MLKKLSYLDNLDGLKRTWGSTFVPRPQFGEFSKGVYSSGFMANCDSAGTGPDGAFFLGKTKCYPVDSAIEWLKARATDKRMPAVKKR